jgi:Dolichyl-phosphate-mannose-protein mannosyltransferase
MNDRPTQDTLEVPGSEATAARPGTMAYAPAAPQRTALVTAPKSPAATNAAAMNGAAANAAVTRAAAPEPSGLTRESEPRRPEGTGHKFAQTPGLLLVAILTLQAVLSLRLVWANTAFLDEATYLFAGHAELSYWLHGASPPSFATYFSGAPVIYPPLAALAASMGGVTAARLLSLGFMLGATGLLWGTTSKLFGTRSAFFAAALFAVTGPTQALGAFATYDAMALFLLAASAWCVVSAQDRDNSTFFLTGGILLLALANATKYATAVLDPTVVALAVVTVVKRRGLKPGLVRGGYLAAGTLGLVSAVLALGGPDYLSGVLSTTLSRAHGNNPASLILADAAKWCGLICVLAGLGVICALRRHDRAQLAIVTVLAAAGLLVPLNQARIHTTTSLFKQVDFGVWFAAAAAGFAIAHAFGAGRRAWLRAGAAFLAGTLTVVLSGTLGRTQASSFVREWPNSTQTMAELRYLTGIHPGNYLAEDYNVPAYYLESSIPWQRWSQTWTFTYPGPNAHQLLSGEAAYQAAIDNGYFSLIALSFTDTTKTDAQIVADMRRAGTYHLVAAVSFHDAFGTGHELVWAYEPHPADHQGTHGHG